MTRQIFEQIFLTSAEIVGKTVTERSIALYWGALQNAESSDLREALEAFAAKGKWPTVNELLSECRMKPRQTRQERGDNAQPTKTGMDERELDEWHKTLKGFGEFAWPCTIVHESLEKAESEMLDFTRQLTAHGWLIEGSSEMMQGQTESNGKIPGRKFWRRFYYASKSKTEDSQKTPEIRPTRGVEIDF